MRYENDYEWQRAKDAKGDRGDLFRDNSANKLSNSSLLLGMLMTI
jgi:hypothetical protein